MAHATDFGERISTGPMALPKMPMIAVLDITWAGMFSLATLLGYVGLITWLINR